MNLLRSLISRALLLACGVAISACTLPTTPEILMKKNNPVIADLRPWCIGRLLFDRPKESRVYSERYEYAGSDIALKPDFSEESFDRIVNQREQELRTKKRVHIISYKEMREKGLASMEIETPYSLLEMEMKPSSLSRIFLHKKDDDRDDAVFKKEGYILVGRNLLTLTGLAPGHQGQEAIRQDAVWYAATTSRDDWEIPVKRGFCVKGALIGGEPDSTESVVQASTLPSDGPAALIIKMRSSLDVDKKISLLDSLPDLRRRLDRASLFSKVRVLRSAKRMIAGMQAEEVLLAMKADGVEMFRFYLIAPGTEDDHGKPYMEVQMQLGSEPRDDFPPEEATSAVDEAGALQAWDTLIDSFRLRPGAI